MPCMQANGRRLLDATLYPVSTSAGRSLLATTSTYGVNVITVGTFDRNILISLSATFKLFSDTTNGPGGIGAAVPRLNDVVRVLSNNQAAVTGGGRTLRIFLPVCIRNAVKHPYPNRLKGTFASVTGARAILAASLGQDECHTSVRSEWSPCL